MNTLSPPLRAADELDLRRLVLRDGSVAAVRPAAASDTQAMRRFFHELSPEARRHRFFISGEAPDTVIDRFCNAADPAQNLTLIACRRERGHERIIAVASYFRITDAVAEAAFAVDDHVHGQGIATLLLERLAALASASGFARFQATTMAENQAMLEVFRDSGFEVRSKLAHDTIEVQLSLLSSDRQNAAAEARSRLATAASLQPLFVPRAVAVVGASRDPASIGGRILHALITAGFRGPVYPVNPNASEVHGLPARQSARQLPAGVDLAIVAVPAASILDVVDDCAAAGVKSLVIVTAGFAEVGATGRALQDQLVDRVRGYGMRMVGPNCLGLLNTDPAVRLNASFSPMFPRPGQIALSSQSGALGLAILGLAAAREVGFSQFVSVGNKADVSGNDLLEYWDSDPRTHVILLYLESFGNPRRFGRLARRISRSKPIVAVKAGRTRAGSRAAGSHTAALAVSDTAVDALFHQSGVIRAGTIDEMFDLAACLDAQPLPKGGHVAIVTNAGGPGILTVDACVAAGLTVSEFSTATCARLAAFLPPTASVCNPVDMVASAGPEEYRRAIEVAASAEEADALIIIFTPVDTTRSDEILAAIRDGIRASRVAGGDRKPILACVMSDGRPPVPLRIDAETIPTYAFPENAARALAKVAAYSRWRSQPPGLFWGFDDIRIEEARNICRQALAQHGDGWLTTEDAHAVLQAFGLPLAAGAVARTPDEAARLAVAFGFPVVAKLSSRRVVHKSDVGAVRLNLTTADDVREAFHAIMANNNHAPSADSTDGVLIQPMVTDAIETIVGATADPLFGPLVGFGPGGTQVEILGDMRFRVAPLTDHDADELLREGRGFRLLQGYPGHPAADVAALRDVLLRVSRLAEAIPEIAELDLNPVMALAAGKGCRIVDARIKVARSSRPPSTSVRQEPHQ
jgi:acetyl coenzyme A synthetase (ADP forming)-like protein